MEIRECPRCGGEMVVAEKYEEVGDELLRCKIVWECLECGYEEVEK